MVDQNSASWNRATIWLMLVDGLRQRSANLGLRFSGKDT